MIKKALSALAVGTLLTYGSMAAPSMAAPHANATMPMMNVMLGAQAFSGVTGTATLSYDSASGMTTVKLTVKHLEPKSVHPAHIHAGKCTSNGMVLAALNSVTADAMGTGKSTTMVKGSFAHKAAYINVHLGPGLALTQYTVLACGVLGAM